MTRAFNPELLERMRRDWDDRARENARHYVATAQNAWSDEEFFRSGESNVREHILNDMTNICQGKNPAEMRVLEIGCGAGRITRALAKIVGRVDGVDVSGEMLRRARQALHGGVAMPYLHQLWRESAERAAAAWRNGSTWRELGSLIRELAARVPEALREFPNAGLHQNNGVDLAMFGDEQFDFAFSYIVFQHIPSREIIENYVREVRRVLKPGALFKFQVQGDPLYNAACDTWQGVGFTEEEMREMAERCGFEMRHTYRADEQYLWLWFFKRPAGAAAQP